MKQQTTSRKRIIQPEHNLGRGVGGQTLANMTGQADALGTSQNVQPTEVVMPKSFLGAVTGGRVS